MVVNDVVPEAEWDPPGPEGQISLFHVTSERNVLRSYLWKLVTHMYIVYMVTGFNFINQDISFLIRMWIVYTQWTLSFSN